MSYSWYNVASVYEKNTFKWRKMSDDGWKTVTIPDGMYDYNELSKTIQSETGTVDPNDKDSEFIFKLYFHTTIYRVIILIQNGYEPDLREGGFTALLGFDKKVLSNANNRGDRVPNITRSVDWVFIHCDLISRQVDNDGDEAFRSRQRR